MLDINQLVLDNLFFERNEKSERGKTRGKFAAIGAGIGAIPGAALTAYQMSQGETPLAGAQATGVGLGGGGVVGDMVGQNKHNRRIGAKKALRTYYDK